MKHILQGDQITVVLTKSTVLESQELNNTINPTGLALCWTLKVRNQDDPN